ncbi:MAG TPA: hypothetical protein VJ476_12880 [Rhizomicrobium sp.]|nr:hypothetical protein [Rhizomicrobium sp.]
MFARTLLLSLILTTPAFATDCSMGPIAGHPVSGTVAGKPFVPKETNLTVTRNGMGIDGVQFDRYTLAIMTDGIFNEATVDMLVPAAKKPDGRTFRVLPTDSIHGQPQAAEGTPEVQGWDLQLETANVDTSFTQEIAAIRVEFGHGKGASLPGKIHFCVPGQKAEIEGSFTAKME